MVYDGTIDLDWVRRFTTHESLYDRRRQWVEFWSGLSPEVRQAVDDAARDYALAHGARLGYEEVVDIPEVKVSGNAAMLSAGLVYGANRRGVD